MSMIDTNDLYIELVTFEIDDRHAQLRLLDGLTTQVNAWVKTIPGFVSANFHLSLDGKKLFNYAQWRSRSAWETFGADQRREQIRDVVRVAGARHLSGEGYFVARIVEPAVEP
jgi:C-6 monooxygenase